MRKQGLWQGALLVLSGFNCLLRTAIHLRSCSSLLLTPPSQSSLILHYVHQGAAGLRSVAERHTAVATAGAVVASSGKQDPQLSPTIEATHYVASVGSLTVPADVSAHRRKAFPSVLAVTEWPQERTKAEALGLAASACDALVFVVNPTEEASVRFFVEHVAIVPDRVPVIVVASVRPLADDAAKAALVALQDMCDASGASHALGLDLFMWRPMVRRSSSDPRRRCFCLMRASSLEQGKADMSVNVFAFLRNYSARPSSNNPDTPSRRWRHGVIGTLLDYAPALLVGGAVVGAAATAAYIASTSERRSWARDALSRVLASFTAAVASVPGRSTAAPIVASASAVGSGGGGWLSGVMAARAPPSR